MTTQFDSRQPATAKTVTNDKDAKNENTDSKIYNDITLSRMRTDTHAGLARMA
jgi:hypothetical protein